MSVYGLPDRMLVLMSVYGLPDRMLVLMSVMGYQTGCLF